MHNGRLLPACSPATWTDCLAAFERELTPQQFSTWIRPLTCETIDGCWTLKAPNRFLLRWVKERFADRIEALVNRRGQAPILIQFALADAEPAVVAERSVSSPPIGTTSPVTNATPSPKPSARIVLQPPLPVSAGATATNRVPAPPSSRRTESPTRLDPALTFDSFVSGKANQLARAAGLQVASHPTAYNPLFVYGGVGLGKTHLIQAIGNHILGQNPTAKIRYVHAEAYVSDVVRAYQHKAFEEFKRYYRSLDLLLVDDIQFFGNKNRTQEEFFYLFNTLIEAHKQVVITCDTYPKEIAGIEERLVSRLGWGLTVALDPPELEMRVAILLDKAAKAGIRLDQEVGFFIAKHIRSNVRELEGALKRVTAYADFHKHPISLPVAKEALQDLLAVQNRQISIDNIQKTVAEYYKLRVTDLTGKKRSRAIARPRQVAMTLTKELTEFSLPAIGAAFGGRDHTTVLHACRQITKLRESHPGLNQDVVLLLQVLRS